MPDAEPINYRLSDLKLRWQRDPSSRLFLQLANEHRKAGQVEEAVAVLEQGLEHRPNDLSALVVLGRCRLELGRADEAVEPLETVISRDPTHIVASKLLIEAHLQRGDADQAAERLRMYRLLNDRDPELDHLEYRLERLQAEAEPATGAGGELEGTPEAAAPAPVEAVAEVVTPVAQAPRTAAAADLFPLTDEGPAPDLEALWRTLPTLRPAVVEPFVGLGSLDAASHWDLISREGIFTSPGAPAEDEAPAEDDFKPEPAPGPVAEALADAPPEPEPMPEPEPVVEPELEAEAIVEAETVVEPEPVWELEPDGAVEVAEPEAEPAPAAAAEALEPTDAAPDGEPATVTLGELYLRQGYRDEAERIFHQVLKQDPGNRTALDNLARLNQRPGQSRPGQPLTAADLLAVRSASARVPEGLTAKKVLVLGNYVKHLRAAAQKHVS
jgi:tetratricopeptide (TPR) repeat protein